MKAALLSQNLADARLVLDAVLSGYGRRIQFTPLPKQRSYLISVPVAFGKMLSAIVPMAHWS